ncbi:aldo/keto reductase, partial [Secundilactobacillus collinoides]|uniref:aldo/keto reductase n=1 Tax=Secundilactobacillus collinoides TaxID=33960 RepID=UPI000AF29CAD
MNYTTVGNTGIKVSELCFGAMSFGGDADEKTSQALFDRVTDAGINFFDTADMYVNGESERILGKLIAGKRNQYVLSSKVYFPASEDAGLNDSGLSRRHIMQGIEGSLRRLNTDYLDFYILHYFDSTTAIEETLRALVDRAPILGRIATLLFEPLL